MGLGRNGCLQQQEQNHYSSQHKAAVVGASSGQHPDSGREAFKVEDPVMEGFSVRLPAPQAGTCSEWTLHPVGMLIHSF